MELHRAGMCMGALVEGREGIWEPSVTMKNVFLCLVERRDRKRDLVYGD